MTTQFYGSGFGMKRILVAATFAACALTSGVASATDGWYTGLGMGGNLMHDSDLKQSRGAVPAGATRRLNSDHEVGFAADLTAGYGFANGLRAELDLGHTVNQFDKLGTFSGPNVSGEAEIYTITANLLYDFKNTSPFTPYAGAGLGGAYFLMDDVRAGTLANPAARISEGNWGMFGKLIAGLTYDFSDYIDIFGQYQFASTLGDVEFDATTPAAARYKANYQGSSLLAGVRYVFHKPSRAPSPVMTPPQVQPYRDVAPAPAPEPAPAAAPAAREPEVRSRSYLVFFDFDSDKLTDAAKDIINKAVEDAKSVEVVRLELTGHADRSGKETYNNALSMRRAKRVKSEVVNLGISESLVGVVAKGESEPLVQTPDGVREPQNRRVEIVYTVKE